MTNILWPLFLTLLIVLTISPTTADKKGSQQKRNNGKNSNHDTKVPKDAVEVIKYCEKHHSPENDGTISLISRCCNKLSRAKDHLTTNSINKLIKGKTTQKENRVAHFPTLCHKCLADSNCLNQAKNMNKEKKLEKYSTSAQKVAAFCDSYHSGQSTAGVVVNCCKTMKQNNKNKNSHIMNKLPGTCKACAKDGTCTSKKIVGSQQGQEKIKGKHQTNNQKNSEKKKRKKVMKMEKEKRNEQSESEDKNDDEDEERRADDDENEMSQNAADGESGQQRRQHQKGTKAEKKARKKAAKEAKKRESGNDEEKSGEQQNGNNNRQQKRTKAEKKAQKKAAKEANDDEEKSEDENKENGGKAKTGKRNKPKPIKLKKPEYDNGQFIGTKKN